MPPKEQFPEGAFTQSEHWPHLKYGIFGTAADVQDAQMQVVAKFCEKEAGKREEFERYVESELHSTKVLM